MPSLMTDPALKYYALAASIVALQLIVLALWTGAMRAMRKTFVNPEDAKLNKTAVADDDHADVLRVKRAHQNAIENAIPFFAIGLLYALTSPPAGTAQIYFFVFAGARVLHSVFYLWGRQPFRTLMFVTGVLCTIGMAQHVIRAAL